MERPTVLLDVISFDERGQRAASETLKRDGRALRAALLAMPDPRSDGATSAKVEQLLTRVRVCPDCRTKSAMTG